MNADVFSAQAEHAPQDFAAMGLHPILLNAVQQLGYGQPTAIQSQAVPAMLAGRDVLGQAATGTGKTAAFGLPLVQLLMEQGERRRGAACMILVPTRELAIQVANALKTFATGTRLHIVPIYGGQPISTQLRELKRGVDILVATPGRMLDHLERGSFRLDMVQFVVLDEADEMLDMGFAEALEIIFSKLPEKRQTALFSATLPRHIADIAARHLHDPVRIRITPPAPVAGSAPRVRQVAYVAAGHHKSAALGRILSFEDIASAIIFCRTRVDVDSLTAILGQQRQQRTEGLHGGMSQQQRDHVMERFRKGDITLLVATDVAARGLDIDHVSHVINYDIPQAAEVYVHRIGRTGRAGREGVAITLIKPNERRFLQQFERKIQGAIEICELPSLQALRAQRLERAKLALQTALQSPELAAFRQMAMELVKETDILSLASVALMQAHAQIPSLANEQEIPRSTASSSSGRTTNGRSMPHDRDRESSGRGGYNGRDNRRGPPAHGRDQRQEKMPHRFEVARLFVGAGHDVGVGAADLVGAIANELNLDSRAIGKIEINTNFSLVDVPASIADDIVKGMHGASIKGRRVVIRRDKQQLRGS